MYTNRDMFITHIGASSQTLDSAKRRVWRCLGTILVAASTYFIKQGKVKLHQTEILNTVATLTEINLVNIHTLSQSLQIAKNICIVELWDSLGASLLANAVN